MVAHWVQYQASKFDICGGQRGNRADFLSQVILLYAVSTIPPTLQTNLIIYYRFCTHLPTDSHVEFSTKPEDRFDYCTCL